jgi:hypothetical protein
VDHFQQWVGCFKDIPCARRWRMPASLFPGSTGDHPAAASTAEPIASQLRRCWRLYPHDQVTAPKHRLAGLLGSFLWYRPEPVSDGYIRLFRGIIARFSPAKAGFTAGQSSFTGVPGQEHNCFPSAVVSAQTQG